MPTQRCTPRNGASAPAGRRVAAAPELLARHGDSALEDDEQQIELHWLLVLVRVKLIGSASTKAVAVEAAVLTGYDQLARAVAAAALAALPGRVGDLQRRHEN